MKMKRGIFIIEPIRLSVKNDGQFIMYQTIGISLVHKSKYQTNQRYRKERYVNNKNFDKFNARCQKMIGNKDKNHYDLLVPKNDTRSTIKVVVTLSLVFLNQSYYIKRFSI